MNQHIDNTPFWTKKILTIDEAVAYTGFSKKTIQIMALGGRIPHSRPTQKRIFFDREQLERWMMSKPAKMQEEVEQEAISMLINNHGVGKSRRRNPT